ncbi:MAG: amidohydrolase family protein [Bacteroidetes bacterium]|nr:amidohydrolase family protein [Bacteroidota bacterium]
MAEKNKENIYSWLKTFAGNYDEGLKYKELSDHAKLFIEDAFTGIDENDLRDYHCHILGIGTGHSGNYIHYKMTSWALPINHLKFNAYSNAAGIKHIQWGDQEYIARLVSLVKQMPGKVAILAWDKFYKRNGLVDTANTMAYVPNELVYEIYQRFPGHFIPCVSIHPYRNDALNELSKWAELGVRQVKWAPNSMGIDPSDKKCIPFYSVMKELDMVLLTHTGKEDALPVSGYQHLGNPLLYRRPLDMGVKIIMAHCASLGKSLDFEAVNPDMEKNYKLFLRLMKEKQYSDNLFGDISGITQINRCGEPLKALLKARSIHHRLINGSDYPLPAINSIIWTKTLENLGYINNQERKVINEIYKYNPMLFDFVLKRNLKHPKTKAKFRKQLFTKHQMLEPQVIEVGY